jgi:uncharacterized membrane protein
MRLFPITIDVKEITDEMIKWAETQNAKIEYEKFITFPNSKQSTSTRLHFNYTEKSTALLFLMIFNQHVTQHNMEELNVIKDLYVTT